MPSRDPQKRVEVARIAATKRWANTPAGDRRKATEPARRSNARRLAEQRQRRDLVERIVADVEQWPLTEAQISRIVELFAPVENGDADVA